MRGAELPSSGCYLSNQTNGHKEGVWSEDIGVVGSAGRRMDLPLLVLRERRELPVLYLWRPVAVYVPDLDAVANRCRMRRVECHFDERVLHPWEPLERNL
jgi:hypothetical protein